MQHFPIKFQSASAMMGLNSRIARLDNIIGFILKGKLNRNVFVSAVKEPPYFGYT